VAVVVHGAEEFVAGVREPARARASERLYHHFAYGEIVPTALGRYRSMRLPVPTLMLNGTRDFAFAPRSPETLRGYEPYADDLRMELVEGGGHFLAEDRPERVAAAARELFKG
jgi:pimeloyl-ACP methyl ester carboxylesterase